MFLWKNAVTILMFSGLLYFLMLCIGNKKSEDKKANENEKRYILWVTTKHEDGGYSSRWYGWSQKLILSYDEAESTKNKLQYKFYDVEIVEI